MYIPSVMSLPNASTPSQLGEGEFDEGVDISKLFIDALLNIGSLTVLDNRYLKY